MNSVSLVSDWQASHDLGMKFGAGLAAIVLIWGAFKCSLIARRDGANRPAIFALMIALMSWLMSILVFAAMQQAALTPTLQLAAVAIVMASLLGALLMAIVGLVQIRRAPAAFLHGRTQGRWACVLCVLVSVMFLFGMTGAMRSRADVVRFPGPTFRDDSLNFEISLPGAPWTRLDPKQLNPSAVFAVGRRDPEVFFMVIAERAAGEIDTDSLARLVKTHLESAAESVEITASAPHPVGNLEGIRLRANLTPHGMKLHYAMWVFAHEHVGYQLATWCGVTTPEPTLTSIADQLTARFRLLDREPVASEAAH
jgi:hypothetical protein